LTQPGEDIARRLDDLGVAAFTEEEVENVIEKKPAEVRILQPPEERERAERLLEAVVDRGEISHLLEAIPAAHELREPVDLHGLSQDRGLKLVSSVTEKLQRRRVENTQPDDVLQEEGVPDAPEADRLVSVAVAPDVLLECFLVPLCLHEGIGIRHAQHGVPRGSADHLRRPHLGQRARGMS
jgi:hypothetical protein